MKLDEIKKLIDAATPGPWKPDRKGFEMPCGAYWMLYSTPYNHSPEVAKREEANAAFIAASRTLMPKLVAIAELAPYALACSEYCESRCGHKELEDALAALEADS